MTVLDRFRLDGRVAVVTGASAGLGVAFATALAEAGADLALGARRKDRLDETARTVRAAGSRCVTRETPEQFRAVMDVNLHGSYWMAQACGRRMLPGSSIINVSSVLAVTTAGLPQAAYSASKAAILGSTRDLAQQWGTRKGIRVNALLPGFFASEMTDRHDKGYLASRLPWVGRGS